MALDSLEPSRQTLPQVAALHTRAFIGSNLVKLPTTGLLGGKENSLVRLAQPGKLPDRTNSVYYWMDNHLAYADVRTIPDTKNTLGVIDHLW